jgi:hypothetical protein
MRGFFTRLEIRFQIHRMPPTASSSVIFIAFHVGM